MHLEYVLPNTSRVRGYGARMRVANARVIDSRCRMRRRQEGALLETELNALEFAVEQERAEAVRNRVISEEFEQKRVELEHGRMLTHQLVDTVQELQEYGRKAGLIVDCVIVASRKAIDHTYCCCIN